MSFWTRGTPADRDSNPPLGPDELRAAVQQITWWHSIDLGHGIVTPGGDRHTQARLDVIRMPADLTGLTVLDVGAWDGFFSFEAERRGARRVLATDSHAWGDGGWSTQAGFNLARRALGSKVEDKKIDVLDLSPDTVGVFDLVLCLGVLYHMRHPLLALERVASVTRGQLILSTQVDLTALSRPAIAFYPGTERSGDPTNWSGPNPAAVVAMLEVAGFSRVEIVSQSFPDGLPLETVTSIQEHQHITVHAWK